MKRLKKTIIMVLALLMLMCILPCGAFAEGEDAAMLSIETEKTYAGMTKSYANGYMPTVTDDKAIIVLPLKGNAKNNTITVTPRIDTESPFVYGNYQFDVKKSNGIFLVRLDLPLREDRKNGLYPVEFNIEYMTDVGKAEQIFSVFVNVTNAKKSGSPELFITDYKISPKKVNGGDEFTVSVTLSNIGSGIAKKVRLTYDGVDGESGKAISPSKSLNILRLDDIPAGKSVVAKFKMKADKNAIAGRHEISVAVSYGSSEFTKNLFVDINQPTEVSIDDISIPDEVESGTSIILPISLLNTGKSAISDVTCKLDMDGMLGSSLFIGEVAAQSSGMGEMKIFVGTLTRGSELYGGTDGKLSITYKDADGNEHTETVDLYTNIIEAAVDVDATAIDEDTQQKPQGTTQWYVSVIIAIAVIAIATAVIVIVNFNRRLKLMGK